MSKSARQLHRRCRTSRRSSAPRSSGCGSRRPTTRATWRSTTRSSRAWSTPTAASATRCASCSPTPATSTRQAMRCRSPSCSRSTAGRSGAAPSCRPRSSARAMHRGASSKAATTRSTSSTRWSPSCRCSARRTWARFYLDILKDRLYTTAPDSHGRRSAQTALWHITARDAALDGARSSASPPRRRGRCSRAPRAHRSSPRPTARTDAGRAPRCSTSGRASAPSATCVNKEIEAAARHRRARLVAAGRLTIGAPAGDHALLAVARRRPALRLHHLARRAGAGRRELDDRGSTPARAPKCERCWHWRDDVGHDPSRPALCGRCTDDNRSLRRRSASRRLDG